MRKVCAKMFPKNLMTEQKASRRDGCEREPEFFSRVITGEESWISEYDRETKRQSREWHTPNSPCPKRARMRKSKIKSVLVCFFSFWQSGNRPQGISATRTKCQSNFLSGSPWKTQEEDGTCATRHCTRLDAAPRQRPMSHGSFHQWIFGRKKSFLWFLSPLFAGSQSLWLLFFSRLQNHLKGAILVLWIISRRV